MESSSAKRQKTKGKAIIEEEEEEGEADPLASPSGDLAAEMTCGICLSDVGRSIRGRIDSCDHHFCFVCIMEWAKVETRCPLCKQRSDRFGAPRCAGCSRASASSTCRSGIRCTVLLAMKVQHSLIYMQTSCAVNAKLLQIKSCCYFAICVTQHLILTVWVLGPRYPRVIGTAMTV